MQCLARAIFENQTLTPLPVQLEGGLSPVLVSGLSPVHRANLAAALRVQLDRPIFVVAPDDAAAEGLARDLSALTGEAVTILTSREFTFYSAESASRQAEQTRIKAMDALAREAAPLTVCTAAALLQRTLPPEVLEGAAFTIEAAGAIPPEEVERRLLRCGYLPTEQVEGPGQFSRRGGILDFFSPAYAQPVRIEFWGDEVDSMGFFDVASQRRTENLASCRILPAAEALPSLAAGGAEGLAQQTLELLRKMNRRSAKVDHEKLAQTLREDADRLQNGLTLTAADRYLALLYPRMATAADYIPYDAVVVMDSPAKCAERAAGYERQLQEDVKLLIGSGTIAGPIAEYLYSWELLCAPGETGASLWNFPVVLADAFTVGRYPMEPGSILSVTAKQLPSYGGSAETAMGDVQSYLDLNYRVLVLAGDERRAGVMQGFLKEHGVTAALEPEPEALPAPGTCLVAVGALSAGLEYPDARLAVLTDTQMLHGSGFRKKRSKALKNREKLASYADLSPGDLVVHEYHGIGRFAGIFKMPVDGVEKDYIKICYAGTDSLYVPATQLDLVSKYIGGGGEDKPVRLSKMGGTDWHRAKSRAKAAARELAGELLALYAQRHGTVGHAFAPDSPWQQEFEEAFGYQETDDQLRCIAEIKADMESPVPMDRLLCGDVGYGKTEVALRAVMKCVLDGYQAAILVPTTVLAQQHYQTAVQRFFGFPVKIEVLSRFRSPAQMKAAKAGLKDGSVDIIIGTHALLQKEIRFKRLGLLVVDEEQRFGVTHKEHIKEMSRQVDVLTLSATPIPRTLNMALSGIRDMSTIEEPPMDRLPVQTFVMEHDWGVICDAIRREIQRGGQVYYLHNRVDNIEHTAVRLQEMLEDVGATVGVAHGRMDEEQLSAAMENVQSGETQVLVCTTIIETGIDIPNVNTLIIEDADKLGLAQLHQIRGRVGRSNRRAAAYLTFRRDKVLTEIAEKRLSAIREFAEFNSGFRIAMRDLEIRGAGSILGAEQSGHMTDVGYDMYLKLLEEAVAEQQGKKPEVHTECAADLSVSANIPETYVRSPEQRMDLYRRIAMIRTEAEADDLTDELIDRFGDLPPAVNALVHVALLRGEAQRAGITDISQKAGALRFVLADFDMERITALYAGPEFKGRLKVEAGAKPCLSLRLRTKRVIEEARQFVAAWRAAAPDECAENV
jgi:transcription-repair coupling factor (superfamily II helicase)